MTLDNSKEFARHTRLDKLVPEEVFFSTPGHPWERGTNEDRNELIRHFLPKRSDNSELSHRHIEEIEKSRDERPRKTRGYKTPHELFTETNTKIGCV